MQRVLPVADRQQLDHRRRRPGCVMETAWTIPSLSCPAISREHHAHCRQQNDAGTGSGCRCYTGTDLSGVNRGTEKAATQGSVAALIETAGVVLSCVFNIAGSHQSISLQIYALLAFMQLRFPVQIWQFLQNPIQYIKYCRPPARRQACQPAADLGVHQIVCPVHLILQQLISRNVQHIDQADKGRHAGQFFAPFHIAEIVGRETDLLGQFFDRQSFFFPIGTQAMSKQRIVYRSPSYLC